MKHAYLNMMQVCQAIEIQDTSAVRASDWISLKEYAGVVFIVLCDVGTGADDVTLTLQEATSAAGAGAQAFTPRRWYRKSGADLGAVAAPTEVTGANIVLEGSEENLAYVEIDASELSDGYAFVQINSDAGGAAAKFIGAIALAVGPRHATNPTELASALA